MNNIAKKPIELPMLDIEKCIFGMELHQKTKDILCFRKGMNITTKQEKEEVRKGRRPDIPVWEKSSLTIDEASAYSGVDRDKIRELTESEDCPFVLWIGSKRLIRRKKFDDYLDKAFSV